MSPWRIEAGAQRISRFADGSWDAERFSCGRLLENSIGDVEIGAFVNRSTDFFALRVYKVGLFDIAQ